MRRRATANGAADGTGTAAAGGAGAPMGFTEFVVLIAAMMATQAIAIDAMLPAFPIIVRALNVANENHGQWILTAYMAGMGCGQLFWGMMSDRFGRRPVLLGGLGLYVIAALVCGLTGSFHSLLFWRFIHGAAAASVTVSRSVIRDLYSGRYMARVMSLTFVVFLMVPILAPSLGQLILLVAPWRYIFIVCSVFASIVWLWTLLRLKETLHPEYRMMLTRSHVLSAVRLVLGNRASLCYTLALTVMFGSLMAYVGMVQQIFSDVFHRAGLMPAMFALCAVTMGCGAFVNARIVERLGMRLISHMALLCFIGITALHVVVAAMGLEQIWTFVAFQAAIMACFSLSVSNFGAMAMEPIGAVAGIGASLQGFVSTFGGALVGAAIGRQFNGTTVPLAVGTLCCGFLSLVFVLFAEEGRLFKRHHAATAGASEVGAAEGFGMH
ncbi:MAG TPA: multidrug effflux MFS transporter [Steroidobacteraceae bacterium]|nr:multidrug effflux MFS transporter [Steroidobacteraceae bacterium]